MEAEAVTPQRISPAKLKVIRLLAFALVPALFVGFVGFSLLRTAPPETLVGTKMPEFSLKKLGSDSTLSSADLQGKAIVLNFWASWCPPCRQEARLLEQTWRSYADQGIMFVGVNVWDSEGDARKFLEEYDITYPNGADPGGQILVDYGLAGIPETYLIDREGQIAQKWIGPFSEEALRSLLDELLARAG